MKNKILAISIIFILLSFVLTNSCFAVRTGELVVAYNDKEYDFSEIYGIFNQNEPFVIYRANSGYFYSIKPEDSSYMHHIAIDNGYISYFNSSNQKAPSYKFYKRNPDTLLFDYDFTASNSDKNQLSLSTLVYASQGVYNEDHETFYFEPTVSEPTVIYPAISNTAEDLSTGTFNYILVAPGTFTNTENIGLQIYNITNLEEGDDVYSQKPLFSTTLNSSSSFYNSIVVEDQTEFWYEIPRANLNIDFKNGNTYFYSLLLDGSPIQEIQATIGGLTEEDILNNNFDNLQSSIIESNKDLEETITESNKELQESIDTQTEAIKENNETNKNIFEKIGEILSYLNPFSENFFAYKLVELIVDGLKSLFIPADDFFSLYFDELNNWFSDRLGFLYYPLELLFDLLDRFLNINFAEPVINIPDIKEPFTDVTLIKSTSLNFNELLENETLKNVHDIYFIIVDAFIYIGLVTLLYKKYEEVMTK